MHCYFPSRINKIGEINDSSRQKKEAYKKCSFSKSSSLSELKLGRRTSPSGFRSRSKRKRYLSSYSLNNLKEIEAKKKNLYMRKNQDSPKGWNVQVTKCRIDNNTYWWIPVARIGLASSPWGK